MVIEMEKKKSKKHMLFILLFLFAALGAGACYLYLTRTYAADEGKRAALEESEPALKDGQEYAYAKITSISGNEMAYSLVDASSGGKTDYTETGETGQMQIPVGTEVETKLGAVTTFSRLSNGNVIRMLLQEDGNGNKALIKIWIIG